MSVFIFIQRRDWRVERVIGSLAIRRATRACQVIYVYTFVSNLTQTDFRMVN